MQREDIHKTKEGFLKRTKKFKSTAHNNKNHKKITEFLEEGSGFCFFEVLA